MSAGLSHSAAAARVATLVAEVAEAIPAPSAALGRDEAAWSGFEALLDRAATGLAAVVGPDGRAALGAVMDSPLEAGPVGLLLVERTLVQLTESRR